METLVIILDSSMVEHSAVNRVVVGSSPTRGAKNKWHALAHEFFITAPGKELNFRIELVEVL